MPGCCFPGRSGADVVVGGVEVLVDNHIDVHLGKRAGEYDIGAVVDAIDGICSEVISNSNDYCNDLKDKITSLGDE